MLALVYWASLAHTARIFGLYSAKYLQNKDCWKFTRWTWTTPHIHFKPEFEPTFKFCISRYLLLLTNTLVYKQEGNNGQSPQRLLCCYLAPFKLIAFMKSRLFLETHWAAITVYTNS